MQVRRGVGLFLIRGVRYLGVLSRERTSLILISPSLSLAIHIFLDMHLKILLSYIVNLTASYRCAGHVFLRDARWGRNIEVKSVRYKASIRNEHDMLGYKMRSL